MTVYQDISTQKKMNLKELTPEFSAPFPSILIFGPPGSGKGTLGKFLSSAGNHFHLSSGDIFRTISPETPAGKLFHSYAGRGLLLPDDATLQIWRHYVDGLIATNRYFPSRQLLLLDGIPRTLHQAELLEKHVRIQKIIVLEIQNPNELIQRIQRRAVIEKRSDDMNPDALKVRLSVYAQETQKLLQHYPRDLLARFNANQKPLEVLRDVLVGLSPLLTSSNG